jgi:Metallo-peptidase family M12
MATLRQAIEPHRARGTLPRTNIVSVGDLNRQFRPGVRGSTRDLILKMFEGISEKKPWAIILCRFKGAAPHPTERDTEMFYRRLFEPGSGGLIEYWRDASLGAVDVTGSRVFDWVEVDIRRDRAGGWAKSDPVGPGRSGLVDAAIRAVLKDDEHGLDGFFSQIAVYCENWSVDEDDVPLDQHFAGSAYWIDGSADGRGKVTMTPVHDAHVTAHEMGHAFGMRHDANADATEFYQDPCCIMSQSALFQPAGWSNFFGSAVCLPHLMQRDWMYRHRVLRDAGDWRSRPHGTTVVLAPINDPGAHANLGVALAVGVVDDEWDYLLEYARPTEWNRGLKNDVLFIRRLRPTMIGDTAAILGSIDVPAAPDGRAQFVEPMGNTRFEVQRFDPGGRVVKVNAQKL